MNPAGLIVAVVLVAIWLGILVWLIAYIINFDGGPMRPVGVLGIAYWLVVAGFVVTETLISKGDE